MYKNLESFDRKYRVELVDHGNSCRNRISCILFKLKCHLHGIEIEEESMPFGYRINVRNLRKVRTVMYFPEVFSVEESFPPWYGS